MDFMDEYEFWIEMESTTWKWHHRMDGYIEMYAYCEEQQEKCLKAEIDFWKQMLDAIEELNAPEGKEHAELKLTLATEELEDLLW